MSYALSITFHGNTAGDLHDAISKYLTSAGSATVVTGNRVAAEAASAAGATATSVPAKRETAAEKKTREAAEKKEADDAKKAASAALLEDDTTEEDTVEVTQEQLREVLVELNEKSSDADVLTNMLKKHGAKKLSGLPAEKYAEVHAWAKAELAKL